MGIYSVRVVLYIRIASRVKSGGGAFRDALKATSVPSKTIVL